MRIKICGVTDGASALAAAEAGADAIGFVFAESPRRLAPAEATRIAGDLPPELTRVAVFRLAPPDEVRRVLSAFPADIIQVEYHINIDKLLLHKLLAVIHDGPAVETDAAALPAGIPVLLEAEGRGGRGIRPDWMRASRVARTRRLMLAGGLRPANVEEAIRAVRPWGVDVSSGVETEPGVKSATLIADFVSAARRAAERVAR